MLHHSSNAERAQPYTYDAVRLELQSELIARNAAQCAFCSSGMLLTGYELLSSGENLSRAEIREFISGNMCRCTGYHAIVDAVEAAMTARGRS